MSKMTKAQQKRMVRDIQKKTNKLFITSNYLSASQMPYTIISAKDLIAMEKLTAKWLKRIG